MKPDILDRAIRVLKQPGGALEKPRVLQFPIIDICNSRCQMCHIWKMKEKHPITPQVIGERLADPLFSEIRSVGINGGEPTLRADLPQIGEALFDALPSLRDISLITNAFKTEWVIERTGALAEVVHRRGGRLDVMVSLDGYGEVHDLVRGKPGNFERAVTVLDWLQQSRVADNVRIGFTIVRDNAFGLHRLLRFCKERDLYIKYRLGIPHPRLYTSDLDAPFHLNLAERLNVIAFLDGLEKHYEPDRRQRHFYRSLIGQLRDLAPRKAGCDWQDRGATLTSRGELAYCAVESPVIAKIEDADLAGAWFGSENILDEIKRDKCAHCLHDYVGKPKREEQAKIALSGLRDRLGAGGMASQLYEKSGLHAARARQRFERRKRHYAAMPEVPGGRPDVAPVIVCGWYGTETLGDKAILGGVVSGIRKALGDVPIEVASLDPQISALTREQMPELAGTGILPVDEALALAPHARAVVFGGGPLMGIDELLPMARMFELARAGGGECVVAGCGVGPERGDHYREVIGQMLRLASVRIFRDEASRTRAAALNPACADDPVTCDPAVSWLRQSPAAPVAGEGKRLLLGLRAFPWREYAQEMGQSAASALQYRLDSAIGDALLGLAREDESLTILPVPMCTNPHGSDDRWYYQQLLDGRPGLTGRFDWDVFERELEPGQYRDLFAGADAALTMRFHSLVFALQSGLPSVALDYTMGRGKVTALAGRTGTTCLALASLDAGSLQEHLRQALAAPRGGAADMGADFAAQLEDSLRASSIPAASG